jgi:hypothetical protein
VSVTESEGVSRSTKGLQDVEDCVRVSHAKRQEVE